jgi:hypothetical protein
MHEDGCVFKNDSDFDDNDNAIDDDQMEDDEMGGDLEEMDEEPDLEGDREVEELRRRLERIE